jgi:hypothetical protein
MLSKRVKSELLQYLQIVNHSLPVWRGIDPVRPESLIQGPKLENELPIQERPNYSVNLALGNCPESSVARDFIRPQFDCDIV